MTVRQAKKSDSEILAKLAIHMWSDNTVSDLTNEFAQVLKSENAACFIAFSGEEAIGFAQCQLRNDYVEGTDTSPVGYLEGVFVCEDFRRRGYAKKLLTACEKWARDKGCTEFASDCEIENSDSLNFHLKTGFSEANRIICFRKDL